MRELRRWSASDAEAYEEYGQLMVEMAKFIKPILGIVPPDPTGRDPREFLPLAGLARAFQRLPERQQAVFVQLMTMSASDFLDQWFETDPPKATMSASGIIGTYLGVKSPGRPTSCCTTTWARSTAHFVPGGSPRVAPAA
jgi:phytoene dehydrogenase-like protein